MNRIEEKEAYLTLQCLWPNFSNNFYSSESPDLKNDVENIGIEVTQSTLDMRERISYIANKMNVRMDSDARKNLEIIAFYDKDNLYENYENEYKPSEKEMLYNTKKLIKTKITKFNSNYDKFNTNGLFIFVRMYPFSNQSIDKICKFFMQYQYDKTNKVDLLFLHNIDTLYVYNVKTKKIDEYEIDEDTKNIIYNML